MASSIFQFTETEPSPIVRDFDTFLSCLESTPVKISEKRRQMSYKALATLNELMTAPVPDNTPRTPQIFYPQLHLFFHLALAGGLVIKKGKKSSTVLAPTERIAAYRELSNAEKYFCLLETLWVDCPMAELGGERERAGSVAARLGGWAFALSQLEAGRVVSSPKLQGLAMFDTFSVPCMALFGWCEVVIDEARRRAVYSKKYVPVASLTPTDLGVAICRILVSQRQIERWNLSVRQSYGEWISPPGHDPETDQGGDEPFFAAFEALCPEGELRQSLPREEREPIKGNFIFKVTLDHGVWRTIRLSSEHTLHDLHNQIQLAFKFDDDHLYEFFMDNQRWSEYGFCHPAAEGAAFADEVCIGELDLSEGQSFLYLFDFGDEWLLDVNVQAINEGEPILLHPKIVEQQGEAPKQYGYDEDEGDWDEDEERLEDEG